MKTNFEQLKKEVLDCFNPEDIFPFNGSYVYSVKIENDILKIIYRIDKESLWLLYPDCIDEIWADKETNVFLIQQTYKISKWIDKYIDELLIPLKNKRYITRNNDDSLFIGILDSPSNSFSFDINDAYFMLGDTLIKKGDKIISLDIYDYRFEQYDGTEFGNLNERYVLDDGTTEVRITLCFEYDSYKWDYIGEVSWNTWADIDDSLNNLSLPMHPFIKKFIES